MSLPSYKLSKKGDKWIATGQMPESGRPFTIDAGSGSKDRAEGVVEQKLIAKMASSKGSKSRWKAFYARRAAGAQPSKASSSSTPGDGAPPPPPSKAAPSSRPSSEEIRAKLLHLGDASSSADPGESQRGAVNPDEVIPPGEGGAAEEDPPLDEEGGELIASLLAKAMTLGIVALANAPLKRRKPPEKGEPHEKGLEWYHDGMEFHLKRLVGKTATLGPTGKIFAGSAIIFASVWMSAEPIDPPPAGAKAAAQEPAPAAAAAASSNGHANGHAKRLPAAPDEEPAPSGIPLGVFGVEKRTAN